MISGHYSLQASSRQIEGSVLFKNKWEMCKSQSTICVLIVIYMAIYETSTYIEIQSLFMIFSSLPPSQYLLFILAEKRLGLITYIEIQSLFMIFYPFI